MSEFNPIPTSISHKKLNSLFLKAYKECYADNIKGNEFSQEKEEFIQLMSSWLDLSKEILSHLDKKKQHLTEDKKPNSLMALGAMEVHLNMAIQAFKASQKED